MVSIKTFIRLVYINRKYSLDNIFYSDTLKRIKFNVLLETTVSIILKFASSNSINVSKESNVSQLMKLFHSNVQMFHRNKVLFR